MNIKTLSQMAIHLATADARVYIQLSRSLDAAASKVEKRAKRKIGSYQDANGLHQAWPELAERTKRDRVRKGFTENDPLLRTGSLRNSISHRTKGLKAVIGSTSDVAVHQELGTYKIPPRPFLGAALYEELDAIKQIVGGAAIAGIVGTKVKTYEV